MAVSSFPVSDNRDLYLAQIKARNQHAKSESLPYDARSKKRVAMTLVDLCTSYIESMWPLQRGRLPLRTFVFEILRRSRVQYPVFQVALCYLARCRPYVSEHRKKHNGEYPPHFACGRRIFVAALQIASKFLQDRFYSASVWSRVSGLDLKSLQQNEIALMKALDWRMCVSSENYMEVCRRLRVSLGSMADTVSPSDAVQALTPVSSPVALKSTDFGTDFGKDFGLEVPSKRRKVGSPDVVIYE